MEKIEAKERYSKMLAALDNIPLVDEGEYRYVKESVKNRNISPSAKALIMAATTFLDNYVVPEERNFDHLETLINVAITDSAVFLAQKTYFDTIFYIVKEFDPHSDAYKYYRAFTLSAGPESAYHNAAVGRALMAIYEARNTYRGQHQIKLNEVKQHMEVKNDTRN